MVHVLVKAEKLVLLVPLLRLNETVKLISSMTPRMLKLISNIIKPKNCKSRFLVEYDSENELTDWVQGFHFPVNGYIEIPLVGPIKETQIKWIEIDPVEEIILGRRVPAKFKNHLTEIIKALNDNNIDHFVCDNKIKILSI